MKRLLFSAMFALVHVIANSQIADPQISYGPKNLLQTDALLQEGNLIESREHIRTYLKDFSDGVYADEAKILQAIILREQADYSYADKSLADFIQQRNNSKFIPIAWFERAAIAFHKGDLVISIDYFHQASMNANKLLETDKNYYKNISGSAIYWKGIAHAKLGNIEQSVVFLTECQKLFPDHSLADDALYFRAQLAERELKSQQAGVLYAELLSRYQYSNTVLSSAIRAANVKVALKEPNAAIVFLDQAHNIVRRISQKDSIGLIYEKQVHSEASDQEIQFLRIEALTLSGQYQSSHNMAKEFIRIFPSSSLKPHVWLAAGYNTLHLKEYQLSEQYYQTVIDSVQDDQSLIKQGAKLYHAIVLKALQKREEAKKELLLLNAQIGYPYISQSLLEYGQIAYEDKELEIAKKALQKAERETTDKTVLVKINLLLGSIFLDLEMYGKAAREYASAERNAIILSDISLPNKENILAEIRLKNGVSLHQNEQYQDAAIELSTFLGEHKSDIRKDEALFWLAESYFRLDLLKNAEEFYHQLISDFPKSKRVEESMYALAWTYFRTRDFNKSNTAFSSLLKKYPDSRFAAESWARKADGFYIQKQFKEASTAYKASYKALPNSEEGQYSAYQYGQALYRLNDFDGALQAFRTFIRSHSKSSLAPSASYSLGWTHFQQKKYSEAIEDFKDLISSYPSSPLCARAHYTTGDAYYNMEQYEKAITEYSIVKNSYAQSPLAGESVKSIQYCLEFLGRNQEADQIVDEFVKAHPESDAAKDLLMNKGLSFFNRQNFQSAISEYESFLKSNNDKERNAEALFYLGKSYASLGESSKAESSYKDVYASYSKSEFAPLALLEIGLLKQKSQLLRDADTAFVKLMDEFPNSNSAAQAGYERAQIAVSLTDTLKSLRLFTEIADKFMSSEYGDQSRYKIAMYYRSKGMLDSARVHFGKLIDRLENISIAAEAQYRIGESWLKQKEIGNAIEAFNQVRQKFSNIEDWFTLSLLGLGESYEQVKNIEAAIEVYQTLSTLRADDDFGKAAQAKLKKYGRVR